MYKIDKKRAMSWSQISSFEFSKEQWFDKYILNKKQETNPAMQAGLDIGRRLEDDLSFLPEVPRPEIYELKIETKFGNIPLLGFLDGFSPTNNEILEYKTTQNKKKWTKKSVGEHGQLKFYALLIYLKYDIRPEDLKIKLVSIHVEEDGKFEIKRSKHPIEIFETKVTMIDILNFGVYLRKRVVEMIEYCNERSK